jgi:ribonuclease BN (tRNA processing enzyme)
MTDHLLAAYQADIMERNAGTEPDKPIGYEVHVSEIGLGLIYQDDLIKVEACPAVHGSWPAYSYRFTTPDRTIVISGDTAPHPDMTTTYANCDILVHEVYSWTGFQTRPLKWQKYHSGAHTSTKELAEVAQIVQPGLIVLYHQLFWGQSEASLLEEIQTVYAGKVISGQDLNIF